MATGFVYFIAPAASIPNLVKIGWSPNPAARCAKLSLLSPVALRVIAQGAGTRAHEAAIHRAFKGDRTHGEWFTLTLGLLDLIERVGGGASIASMYEGRAQTVAPVIDHLSALFGSDARLAEAAGVVPSTIWTWRTTNGLVPTKRQVILLKTAPIFGVALTPSDFFEDTKAASIAA